MNFDPRLSSFAERYLPAILTVLALIAPFAFGAATGGSSKAGTTGADSVLTRGHGTMSNSASTSGTPANIIAATNGWRASNHVQELTESASLDAYAQNWAEKMAASGSFQPSHMSTYEGAGGQRLVMSENIFYSDSPSNSDDIITAWDDSVEGHAENQLFPHHLEIGVGVAYDAQGGMWVVQEFGTPVAYADELRKAIGA